MKKIIQNQFGRMDLLRMIFGYWANIVTLSQYFEIILSNLDPKFHFLKTLINIYFRWDSKTIPSHFILKLHLSLRRLDCASLQNLKLPWNWLVFSMHLLQLNRVCFQRAWSWCLRQCDFLSLRANSLYF